MATEYIDYQHQCIYNVDTISTGGNYGRSYTEMGQ